MSYEHDGHANLILYQSSDILRVQPVVCEDTKEECDCEEQKTIDSERDFGYEGNIKGGPRNDWAVGYE